MSSAHDHLRSLDYSVLQQCMHCGLCLASCPTYAETKIERHSPRGRIALMRAIADGELAVSRAFGEEMYYCLGCLACTSACPAGVNYPVLFEAARATAEEAHVLATPQRTFWRWLALRRLFAHPQLLRFVGRLLYLVQRTRFDRFARWSRLNRLLPRRLRELEPATPRMRSRFSNGLIRPVEIPTGPRRYRVALLTGCVQDLAFSEINRATADVLLVNGCEVVTPSVQPCCGSLHAHNGDLAGARMLARRQIDLIDAESVDAIISNAGGCGSHLRHYDTLLGDDPVYAARARVWAAKVRDIHEWLVEIGFRAPTAGPPGLGSVTYHESCHLCHAQRVSAQPRAILRAIPGVRFTECVEATWCCGSAGIYSLTHPETSAALLERKVGHLAATGATTVATANPGCHLQIERGLAAAGLGAVRVEHPIVLLARAYAAERK